MVTNPGERKRHFPEELPVAWDPIRRALEENEDWYRDLVEHSQDLLCVHDLEGRFLSVNPAPARLLGYSVEEMIRKPMRELVDPQYRTEFDAYLREIERTGESRGLLAVMTRSGEQRIWEYHSTLRSEGVATPIVWGTAHDVTERVRAEKALRESELRFRQATRASHIGIFDHDHVTGTIYWSPEQREIYGFGADEVVTLSVYFDHVYAEDREAMAAAVRRAHDPTGDGLFDVEHRIVRRDGDIRWLTTRSQTFFEGEGGARHKVRTVGAVLDITERRQAEKPCGKAKNGSAWR